MMQLPQFLLLPALAAIAGAVLLAIHGPIEQPSAYHRFVDDRTVAGIPNAWNVVSNLPFLLLGAAGFLLAKRISRTNAWPAFFAGVALVAAGSAWYHLDPSDATLLWDRLPIMVAFMALFVAILEECVEARAGALLVSAVILGAASVAWWAVSGDLRLYAWLQGVAVVTVLVAALSGRMGSGEGRFLLLAVALFGLSKWAEFSDATVFAASGHRVSGHTLKHLFTAASIGCILAMLARRPALPPGTPNSA